MSRGKILVHGTSSQIKSEYGIGYEFTFSDLEEKQIKKLKELTEISFEGLELDLNELEITKKIYLIIPISQIKKTGKFIKRLEDYDIHYGLKSNSLEEAFIKMGEKEHKASTKDLLKMEEKIEEISKVEYKNRKNYIILVQFLRRFLLLLKSPIQILILTLMVLFPAFTIQYAFDNFFTNFNFEGVFIEASSTVFMGCMSLLCSVFVYLPGYEREKKIRYIMKKMGVGSTFYYTTLFFCDLIIGLIMCLLAFGLISILLEYDHNIRVGNDYFIMVFSNLIWISTFISQSKSLI